MTAPSPVPLASSAPAGVDPAGLPRIALRPADDPALLERNLAALGERHAALADRLRAIAPPPAGPDGLDLALAPDGLSTGSWRGRPLASRHRPGAEAERLVREVDVAEHGVIVVHGFGAGLHLAALGTRLRRAGLAVVLETDLELLRGVLGRMDHAGWLEQCLLVVIEDPTDRGLVAARLAGAESILGLGLAFLDHPASRGRLGAAPAELAAALVEAVANAKVTLVTTLLRAVDTCRNLTGNLHRYAIEPGIAELEGVAAGRTAICIAAGPSLHRTLRALEDPRVRDRAVLVAAQTTLRPLLERGIRPHFVTALDYHAISKRFYESLTAEDVRGITLVADPKVHPDVLDVYPGRVRLIASDFLDRVLCGLPDDARPAPGGLEPSATVAHMSMRLARFLGCDPVVLVGQDLGFPGNLYYAPGNPIHDVWSVELGPFNTIATMEWERIVRHRSHLSRLEDVDGRSILTDAQMLVYLRHLERDIDAWRRRGLETIDATGGGARKRGATVRAFDEVVRGLADAPPLPAALLAEPPAPAGAARRRTVAAHLRRIAGRVATLEARSRETLALLDRMIEAAGAPDGAAADAAALARHFRRLDELREAVGADMATFHLVDHLNQLGVFRRTQADRRLELSPPDDPRVRQCRQLERDRTNVAWIADAASELVRQLEAARERTEGWPASALGSGSRAGASDDDRRRAAVRAATDAGANGAAEVEVRTAVRVAAVIPVDPAHGGITRRDLALPLEVPGEAGPPRPALARVLERLRRVRATDGRGGLEAIVLLVPEDLDDAAIARLAGESVAPREIAADLVVERVPGPSPLGPAAPALRAARAFAATSWRGGPLGQSAFDEVLAARAACPVLDRLGCTAAVLVGADWAAIDVDGPGGVGAILDRHASHPEQLPFVFTQAPPGRGAALVARGLLGELATGGRLATLGALLGYQPHAPQGDPVARDANVEIPPAVRRLVTRLVADAPAARAAVTAVLAAEAAGDTDPLPAAAAALEAAGRLPHLLLEIEGTTPPGRHFRRLPGPPPGRGAMPIDRAAAIAAGFGPVAASRFGLPWVCSLDGHGDPLRHPEAARLGEVVRTARDAGAAAVHLRTSLSRPGDADRVLAAGVDVVSIDLHADDAEGWRRLHGDAEDDAGPGRGFDRTLTELERLLAGRTHLAGPPGPASIGRPWIVPRLERSALTHEQQDAFFERWMRVLGAAVIDAAPRIADAHEAERIDPDGDLGDWTPDPLVPAVLPPSTARRMLAGRLVVHADGRVPVAELDAQARTAAATVTGDDDIEDAVERLAQARSRITSESAAASDDDDPRLRLRDA